MALPQLGGTTLTIRGAGQTQTTITQSAAGEQLNPRFGALVILKNLAVANAIGGDDIGWNVAFDSCLIRDCNGRFVPDMQLPGGGYWLRDSRAERCRTYVFGVFYGYSALRTTFVDCERPILVGGGGGGLSECTFTRSIRYAAEIRDGTLIKNCTFDSTVGHAIEVTSRPGGPTLPLSIVDSTFVGNAGTGSEVGGAIYINGGSPVATVSGCQFSGNRAATGGAIYVGASQPLSVTDCTFTNNSATAGGGGAIAQEFGGWYQQLTASNCSFVGNTATGDGGAMALRGWGGTATLSNCSFQSNSASGEGGGVSADRLTVAVTNCQFIANEAAFVGGAYSQFIGTTSFHSCTFLANHGGDRAGAVWLYWYHTSQFHSCTFSDNAANFGGGGVWIHGNYCTSAIDGCTFSDNTAPGGHALFVGSGSGVGTSVSMSNCTIRGSQEAGGSASSALVSWEPAVLTVSSTSICASGNPAWLGPVIDGGGNCVVASCADSDSNGIPDECQVVSVPGDYQTIQAAIDTTPKGEFRIVSVAAGTYNGPFALGGHDVLIRGAGAASTVLQLDGQTLGSVVRFDGGESSSSGLDGVTVRGAISGSPLPSNPAVLVGGGVIGLNSAAGIRNCVIESNVSSFGGGAYLLYCTSVIQNTVFRNNVAQADGGGAQFFGGAITMNGCTVTDNLAVLRGGGLHIALGTHVLASTSVSKNHSMDRGGGLSWAPVNSLTASLDLISADIANNTADVAAGGVLADSIAGDPSLSFETSSVCGNLPRPNIVGPHNRDSATVVCDCLGDLSQDEIVNGVDVAIVLSVWGTDGGAHPEWDVTRDGTIDGADLAVVLSGWGVCAP
jgi:predicted outer membrane repeat protein